MHLGGTWKSTLSADVVNVVGVYIFYQCEANTCLGGQSLTSGSPHIVKRHDSKAQQSNDELA